MYFSFVATFSKGMSFDGIVEHFRKYIDESFKSNFELLGTK